MAPARRRAHVDGPKDVEARVLSVPVKEPEPEPEPAAPTDSEGLLLGVVRVPNLTGAALEPTVCAALALLALYGDPPAVNTDPAAAAAQPVVTGAAKAPLAAPAQRWAARRAPRSSGGEPRQGRAARRRPARAPPAAPA